MPKPNTPEPSNLSELEGGVLGLVSESPGATAHWIREQFRQSRSSHWSGSAGAIYPLVKKLSQRGLLEVEESPRGQGVRRTYSITAEGTRQLKRWLGPPLPEWVGAVTYDPIRTRLTFLGVLTPARRLAFLREAEALLDGELETIKLELKNFPASCSEWERVATEGCKAVTQARLQWVRKAIHTTNSGVR